MLENTNERALSCWPDGGLHGRRRIFTDKKEITPENVVSVVETALGYHWKNAMEMQYLLDYFRGKQDIRLKENVKDLESKGSLRIAEFDWKNGNGHSYGFIADEVEKIYPDMVSEDSSGYKVLNYNAAMCAKLAELEATIRKQQEMIDKLEKLIQV